MSDEEKSEARTRWIEMAGSVALSILASAAVASWTISAQIARDEAKIAEHDSRLQTAETYLRLQSQTNSTQDVQLAVIQSQYNDIKGQLTEIKQQIARIR